MIRQMSASIQPPAIDDRLHQATVAVRAYVPLADTPPPKRPRPAKRPSDWVLIFDTETTTDPSQRLRFGFFQLRKAGKLVKHGLFFDDTTLKKREQRVLAEYAKANQLEVMITPDFIEEVFFKFGYQFRATIVGFNLPFDISRLSIKHSSARRRPMRGGFSFQLSANRWRPRVQVKHLSRRAALIRFTAPAVQRTPRGMRKHSRVPVRRGFFVDVKTLGAALTSRSDSLDTLAEFLKVPSRKLATEEHGGPLSPSYIAYAVRDAQVTWECYSDLTLRYAAHQLTRTPEDRIKSEAGIGKAYLKEMGIEPWRLVQPDFPPEIINIIMQTYYGARSEVHLRRVIAQILYCDFLSMYPTICTMMGLWRFVIAKGITYRDSTDATRDFLASVTKKDFQSRNTWLNLATLVQVIPDLDVLPVRAQYGGESQYTIGLNYLTSREPLWYTLADCVNSKFQTGKIPNIAKAMTFEPMGIQPGLQPVNIAGNPAFCVDPRIADFYKLLIELRGSIKLRLKTCAPVERDELKAQEQALKILANSVSYGVFMELNVEELGKPSAAYLYDDDGTASRLSLDKVERPGTYFHPLLATLITAGARLMLGIAERLAVGAGLDWAFCDTDSMAFAKPNGMDDQEFYRRVQGIRGWFNMLNPYEGAGDLLKLEGANYGTSEGRKIDELAPLFIWAISSKRYALFNIDDIGRPVVRKASAHGLGHLMPPYRKEDAPSSTPSPAFSLDDIGVDRWQHDVWYRILEAVLSGDADRLQLSELPNFDQPAASRYASTTPTLLRWFDSYNEARDDGDKVRPFNFLTSFTPRRKLTPHWLDAIEPPGSTKRKRQDRTDLPRPIAPYNANPTRAATNCFDRITGAAIPADRLKTYAEALADYHLHPETKFLNGDYLDRGPTERRHIRVAGVRYIGKEANRWEEQFHLGYDPEAQIEYDEGPEAVEEVRTRIRQAAAAFGQRRLARTSGVSREQIRTITQNGAVPRKGTVARLLAAINGLTINK